MPTVPAWIRALLAADRAVHSTVRIAALVRTELLLAGSDPATRHAVNARVFSAEDTYTPGGPAFAHGLFAWERAALTHPAFPRRGRVLLGGAGGGRELVGLVEAGFSVVAFEPAEALAESLTRVAAGYPGARGLHGGYHDLVRGVRGEGGPLAGLRDEAFDAVILGWASFTHLTAPDEARSLLDALRTLCPAAPVLLSYLGPDDDGRANGRVEALRLPLRTLLGRITGRQAAEGEGFAPGAGFFRRFTGAEVEGLAEAAGYSVALHRTEPYPHTILVPRGDGR